MDGTRDGTRHETGAWRRLENDYLACHTRRANRRLHLVGVPLIALSVLVALVCLDLALPVLVTLCLAYLLLDPRPALLVDLVLVALYLLAQWLTSGVGIGRAPFVATGLFTLGWILQLIGHAIEGNRPAFLGNVKHLFVGPLALADEVLEALGRARRGN